MSIQSEINRLSTAKTEIKTAIAGGGVDVPATATLDDMPALIGVITMSKADKVTSATSGNFAGLDANGNLTDSGKKAADFQTKNKTATATLTVAGWSSNAQTVSVTGVNASNTVIVAPASASHDNYGTAGIRCTAQAAGTLTFTCTKTPTAAITVNVVILEV